MARLTRRTLLASAMASAGGTALAQTAPAAHVKGPLVWLDMDQKELDDAYDQAVYAPNRDIVLKRCSRNSELVRERLGGLHSARLVLWSVDFAPVAALQAADDWTGTGAVMADAARRLEGAGADAILICANTMHTNLAEIEAAVHLQA